MINFNLDFLKAGKAIFTVKNDKDKHFTYKINKKEFKDNGKETTIYFTSVLKGPNNWTNYSYVGIYNPSKNEVFPTKKSQYQKDSIEYKVLAWAIKKVAEGSKLPKGYEIKHSDKCGRCGRLLTTPESIEWGIGPECSCTDGRFCKRKTQKETESNRRPFR